MELYRRQGYHLSGSAVLVVLVQVTLSVVGVDQPPQLSVQGQVGHVVRGKHQQVEGLLPPADLFLVGGGGGGLGSRAEGSETPPLCNT